MQYLLGQRDISGQQATEVLAEAFGLEGLSYVQYSFADIKNGMVGAGVPEQIADLFVEFYESFNDGKLPYRRDSESTTDTKLEDFARLALKPAFDSIPA